MATNENMDTTAVAGNFWNFWNEDERKLFASGLPEDTTEAQIKEHFGQFGEIETVTRLTLAISKLLCKENAGAILKPLLISNE